MNRRRTPVGLLGHQRQRHERHEFNYTNEEAPETVKRFGITDEGKIVEK
jgi:hypothetical protein